jgi:hypothetical protein
MHNRTSSLTSAAGAAGRFFWRQRGLVPGGHAMRLAAIDIRSAIRGHYQAEGLDVPRFDERLRCYELHIGLTHLAYSAFTGDPGGHLPGIARRTRDILGSRDTAGSRLTRR